MWMKERRETMTSTKEQMLMENLVAAMTSGIKHQGANYKLPESMALEYGRLCYNQAVADILAMFRTLEMDDPDLCKRITEKIVTAKTAL